MSIILKYIFQISKSAFSMFWGGAIFLCCYFLNRNAKLKQDNKNLITDIKEINIEAEKIVTIQAKQIAIASRPPLSRDRIHEWMRSSKTTTE